MKAPSVYTLRDLTRMFDPKEPQCAVEIDGKWLPARPEGFYSLRNRLHCAWLAFTGKCDLLKWPGGQ